MKKIRKIWILDLCF